VADAASPPPELDETADEIHVILPWGKLMVGLLRPDADVLNGLARLAKPGATLHAILNGEVWSDPVPVEARDLPDPTVEYVNDVLEAEYERAAGIAIDSARDMPPHDAHAIPSTWAKKLGHGRAAPRFVEFSARFLLLREVAPEDLPSLFALQADRVATDMAGIPSRDQRAFDAQRAELLADPRFVERAVVVGGQVAGHVIRFDRDGRTYVGYIIARGHWGRGIATRALSEFLERHVGERPLYATVAAHNSGSLRVLEKCGFVRAERGEDEVVLRLDR
jgi:RimJ/RimL family protein N-acetyltransferase